MCASSFPKFASKSSKIKSMRPRCWQMCPPPLPLIFISCVCMAGPYVTKEQTHISITTILDQLPKKIQKIIKTFNLLFACIVCFVVSYACLPWGWAALLNGETSGTGMDSYGPALVKPMVGIAALIMGFQFIVNMINFFKEDNKI